MRFFSSGSGVFVQGYHGASSFSDLPITSTLLAKLRIGHGLATCNAICACVGLLMPGKKFLGALACKSAKLGWLPSKMASMVKYDGLINYKYDSATITIFIIFAGSQPPSRRGLVRFTPSAIPQMVIQAVFRPLKW